MCELCNSSIEKCNSFYWEQTSSLFKEIRAESSGRIMIMDENTGITGNQRTSTTLAFAGQRDLAGAGKAKDNLFAEGGVNFYNYIRGLALKAIRYWSLFLPAPLLL